MSTENTEVAEIVLTTLIDTLQWSLKLLRGDGDRYLAKTLRDPDQLPEKRMSDLDAKT